MEHWLATYAGLVLQQANLPLPHSLLSPDMSKVQDDEVGDGTTSVTVLAAELLRVRALSPPPRLNAVVSDV